MEASVHDPTLCRLNGGRNLRAAVPAQLPAIFRRRPQGMQDRTQIEDGELRAHPTNVHFCPLRKYFSLSKLRDSIEI